MTTDPETETPPSQDELVYLLPFRFGLSRRYGLARVLFQQHTV